MNYSILQFNLIFTYSTPHSTIQLLIQPLFNYSTPNSIIRHSIQLFNLSFNYSTSHSTIQPHIQLFNLLFTPYSTLQSFHSDIQTKVSVPSTLEAIQRQTSRALLTGRYFFLIFLVLTLNSCWIEDQSNSIRIHASLKPLTKCLVPVQKFVWPIGGLEPTYRRTVDRI